MDFPKSVPGVGLVNGVFVDEDALAAKPGSLIPSVWGNSVTLEILNVLEAAGVAPDELKVNQLAEAISKIATGAAVAWNRVTGKPTTAAGYGITDVYTRAQVDTYMAGKADRANTAAGYGITDVYIRTQVDNFLAAKANKATTLAGYNITDGMLKNTGGIGATIATSELANAFAVPYAGLWSVTPGTQGVPFSYGSLLHTVYDSNQSWTQIAVDMAGGGMYWRGSINGSVQNFKKLLDESNFNPNTKIQAINCPQAGFTDGTPNTPFMTHSNGTTVGLARADSVVGVGQSWQDVTGARLASTNYTNTTSRPIVVSVIPGDALRNELLLAVSGVEVQRMAIASGSVHQAISSVTAIIPPGATYMISLGSGSISKWSELR